MIANPLDEVAGLPPFGTDACADQPETAGRWCAELLVIQHPALASVRFSCACVGCHHQILTARFGAGLADAWFAVRGDLVHPADVLA